MKIPYLWMPHPPKKRICSAYSLHIHVYPVCLYIYIYVCIWVWLKTKQEGLRRFWSMFPLTRVPFWYRFFEPRPYIYIFECTYICLYKRRDPGLARVAWLVCFFRLRRCERLSRPTRPTGSSRFTSPTRTSPNFLKFITFILKRTRLLLDICLFSPLLVLKGTDHFFQAEAKRTSRWHRVWNRRPT